MFEINNFNDRVKMYKLSPFNFIWSHFLISWTDWDAQETFQKNILKKHKLKNCKCILTNILKQYFKIAITSFYNKMSNQDEILNLVLQKSLCNLRREDLKWTRNRKG